MLTFGNHKLGTDTAVFNMGTSIDCPSRKLGLCQTIKQGVKCYAEKAEIQYKDPVINHRLSQAAKWKSKTGPELTMQFLDQIKRRRTKTTFLRYNESGDFNEQADIDKLNYVSRCLRENGIITYGYTARSDLDFRGIDFLCKGSGFNADGLSGSTKVLLKNDVVPEGYFLCPGSCKKCNLCKINVAHNIAFKQH